MQEEKKRRGGSSRKPSARGQGQRDDRNGRRLDLVLSVQSRPVQAKDMYLAELLARYRVWDKHGQHSSQ